MPAYLTDAELVDLGCSQAEIDHYNKIIRKGESAAEDEALLP